MSKGFYFKLALSNIKKNRKLYLPFIISSVCMVMTYYIIQHLQQDPQVAAFEKGFYVQQILAFGIYVIAFFSLLFFFYTSSFLMKRRQTELGLYNVLGMGKNHLIKVTFWETLIIAFVSILSGLLLGILFSKLAQVLLIRAIGESINYNFVVIWKAVRNTAVIFVAIFLLVFVKNSVEIIRLKTVELLYSKSTGEKEPKGNLIIGIIGLVLLGVGYIISITTNSPMEAFVNFFIAVLFVIAGTYVLLIAGSVALLKILRKNKNYYYKTSGFISTSSMIFRMKKHGAGLASICILSTMVIVMVSSTTCLFYGGERCISEAFPREMEICTEIWLSDGETPKSAEKVLELTEETMDECFKEVERRGIGTVSDKMVYRYVSREGLVANGTIDFQYRGANKTNVFFLTVSDYNRAYGENVTLKDNQVLALTANTPIAGNTISIGDREYEVIMGDKTTGLQGNSSVSILGRVYFVVPSEEDLELARSFTDNPSMYNMFYALNVSYSNENMSGEEKVQTENEVLDILSNVGTTAWEKLGGGESVLCDYIMVSPMMRSRTISETTALYSGLFFLGILLSIVFLGATVLIMYYKQIIEGYDDKARFEILQKVGMSKEEIKKSIRQQILTVFFIPLVLAGIHMAFACPLIFLLLRAFAITDVGFLILTTAITYLFFAVFYVVVFLITSKAYYKIVTQ